jgi:acyl-CoA synthetase (AMP-forming)/AMP-acid ligase II
MFTCVRGRNVQPMFHVNAWGLPYSAAAVGAKLVFPGPALDGKSVYELIETEKCTIAAGVPTVWQGMLSHIKDNKLRFSTLQKTLIGGSACPPHVISGFKHELGVDVLHGWYAHGFGIMCASVRVRVCTTSCVSFFVGSLSHAACASHFVGTGA